jgi:ADP-ribose pyrophosphatase YjhB (NUDIX family)
MASSGFRQICNVRAVHFDTDKGLYLIRSRRAGYKHLWTTPGGDVPCDIDQAQNIGRIVAYETGMFPTSVNIEPFFSRHFPNLTERTTTHISAYLITLPFDATAALRGIAASGLDYAFMNVPELLENFNNLTETTKKVVDTHTIMGAYRSAARAARRQQVPQPISQ